MNSRVCAFRYKLDNRTDAQGVLIAMVVPLSLFSVLLRQHNANSQSAQCKIICQILRTESRMRSRGRTAKNTTPRSAFCQMPANHQPQIPSDLANVTQELNLLLQFVTIH